METWGLGPVVPISMKPPETSCVCISFLHEMIMPINYTFSGLETSLALGHQVSQHSLVQGQ